MFNWTSKNPVVPSPATPLLESLIASTLEYRKGSNDRVNTMAETIYNELERNLRSYARSSSASNVTLSILPNLSLEENGLVVSKVMERFRAQNIECHHDAFYKHIKFIWQLPGDTVEVPIHI